MLDRDPLTCKGCGQDLKACACFTPAPVVDVLEAQLAEARAAVRGHFGMACGLAAIVLDMTPDEVGRAARAEAAAALAARGAGLGGASLAEALARGQAAAREAMGEGDASSKGRA